MLGRVKRLAKLCGFTLETSLRYDSWEYQPNSYMRRMTADLMKEVYGHEMMETAARLVIYAALYCRAWRGWTL